jgi:hypothetical protein
MSEETKTYNGWMNYETWCVNLWLNNDEGSYRHICRLAQSAWDDAEASQHLTRAQEAARELASTLADEAESNMPEVNGLYKDLLTSALAEVDWEEIAEHLIEDDVDKEDDEDNDNDSNDDATGDEK